MLQPETRPAHRRTQTEAVPTRRYGPFGGAPSRRRAHLEAEVVIGGALQQQRSRVQQQPAVEQVAVGLQGRGRVQR